MTTIKDLCQLVTFEDVQRAVNYHYPIDDNDYSLCFMQLSNAVWDDPPLKDEEIILDVSRYDWQVVAEEENIDLDNDEYYSIHTLDGKEEYAVSFRSWDELANIPISEEALRNNTYEEIVAHFIWEITFYGSEEQSKCISNSLQQTVKEIKEGTAQLLPWEEVRDKIRKL